MAYNLIPSTFSDAGSSVKHMDKVAAAEALRLWNYLVNTYGMDNPLAFDPTNKKAVKIARALQTEFTKAEIRRKLKLTNLKFDFRSFGLRKSLPFIFMRKSKPLII